MTPPSVEGRSTGTMAPWTWRGGIGWAARSPACPCAAPARQRRAILWTTSTSASDSPVAWGETWDPLFGHLNSLTCSHVYLRALTCYERFKEWFGLLSLLFRSHLETGRGKTIQYLTQKSIRIMEKYFVFIHWSYINSGHHRLILWGPGLEVKDHWNDLIYVTEHLCISFYCLTPFSSSQMLFQRLQSCHNLFYCRSLQCK